MSSSTRIAVLMPARNASKTISVALRSTLRDLADSDRVYVYNDASDDGTCTILRQFERIDRRVVVLSGDSPIGVPAALNLLIDVSDSTYVARMDADDAVLSGRFARQLSKLQDGRLDAIFTSRVNFGSSLGSFRPYFPARIGVELMPWVMLRANPVPHSSLLARRSSIEEAGRYRLAIAEDYDLWMRMLAGKQRLMSLSLPGIAYRMHPTQVTKNPDWRTRFRSDPLLAESHRDLAISLGWAGKRSWHDDEHVERAAFLEFVRDGLRGFHPRTRAAAGPIALRRGWK